MKNKNMDQLISVEEAKKIVGEQQFAMHFINLPVQEAVGRVLAADLYAPTDIPPFEQSSMDGYAISFENWSRGKALPITHEIPAGFQELVRIPKGAAARIFTGAALPIDVDTVVKQEVVEVRDRHAFINDADISAGDNVRAIGSEIKKGELALTIGTLLTPATVGFLRGIGLSEVKVYAAPAVAIVITGDELRPPGEVLSYGQIYEASSGMLAAALRQMGINNLKVFYAKDNLADTVLQLKNALAFGEVTLVTGGVSVGDYDFVLRAAQACGVAKLFHKINQRPGKPLFFGRKSEKVVFGLPGNPSSVLTCFYEYVWPVLRSLSGQDCQLKTLRVPLLNTYTKSNRLTHFLKGIYNNGKVSILHAQESYRLRSYAMANCLVMLNEDVKTYLENELVEIHLLPSYG